MSLGYPGVTFTAACLSHKLSPVRHEPYHHASGRVFRRPHARAPFVAATFVSIGATCPSSCPMKGAGCYAQNGFTAQAMRLLDEEAAELRGLEVIEQEVRAIDAAFIGTSNGRWNRDILGPVPQDGARGGRDLRLHVSGDVPTRGATRAAKLLAGAARRWRARGGGAVFTYTHQWHLVERKDWGPISVLASCDHPEQVELARRCGYAAALVVGSFPSTRAFSIAGVPGKVVPCPAQTSDTTCAECRLCLDRDLVKLGITIGFAAHGTQAGRIRARAWAPGDEAAPAARRSLALAVVGGRA